MESCKGRRRRGTMVGAWGKSQHKIDRWNRNVPLRTLVHTRNVWQNRDLSIAFRHNGIINKYVHKGRVLYEYRSWIHQLENNAVIFIASECVASASSRHWDTGRNWNTMTSSSREKQTQKECDFSPLLRRVWYGLWQTKHGPRRGFPSLPT